MALAQLKRYEASPEADLRKKGSLNTSSISSVLAPSSDALCY